MKHLQVHPNQRYLMWDDGTPFFYLGDTAWEMLHKLTREEIDLYISARAMQGFNAIQTVALAEMSGLTDANAYGRLPLRLVNGQYDPAAPDTGDGYDYWQHVDYAVQKAAEHGVFIALLPTWGDKIHQLWGKGPVIFNAENAAVYADWLARRYQDQWNLIWVLGGDRPLTTDTHRDVVKAMGQAIRKQCPHHLITFHPVGSASSGDYVNAESYIDFHMVQSGHHIDCYKGWQLLQKTMQNDAKPAMDGEPRYEDHPACFREDSGYFWDASDVRNSAWWAVLEGTCGHTYGNHCTWSMTKSPTAYYPYKWQDVLDHPGAGQVQHLKALRLSRPFFEFRAAPSLVEENDFAMGRQSAGRGEKYAFIYTPQGLPIKADLSQMGGIALRAAWFEPRTGHTSEPFAVVPPGKALFAPPTSGKGQDWVVVLDVVDKKV